MAVKCQEERLNLEEHIKISFPQQQQELHQQPFCKRIYNWEKKIIKNNVNSIIINFCFLLSNWIMNPQ